MAELIYKGALYDAMTEEYKKHYAGTGKGYDFTIAMQMVQNQPTTTEAEIRALAIDEFAEKLKHEIRNCSWQFSRLEERTVDEMVKQLKEE